MKKIKSLIYIYLFFNSNINAQVITDGSMGDIKYLSGNMTIPQNLGTTAGNNLFHSFKSFDINNGESVTFTGADNLKNVISRVTGNDISHINGLLKSEIKNANFYFINPAGVFFGEGAKVDVPAAFHISTSDSLNFKDNTVLTLENKSNSLSIAEPADFGFLNSHAGDISIKDSTLRFTQKNDVLFNSSRDIFINDSTLNNSAGNITTTAENNIYLNNSTLDSSVKSELIYVATVKTKTGNIDKSTQYNKDNAGQMTLSAKNIYLSNTEIRSDINARTRSDTFLNAINVNRDKVVKESIFTHQKTEKPNVSDKTLDFNGNLNNNEINGSFIDPTGQAGSIKITSDNELIIENGSILSSSSNNIGNAGTIALSANKVIIDGNNKERTGIFTNSGAVLDKNIDIVQQKIKTLVNIDGKTLIETKYIDTERVLTNVNNTANAGNITISGHDLILQHNAEISSSAYNMGSAGNIEIQNNSVSIDNSKIDSNTFLNLNSTVKNVGKIDIASKAITLQNNGNIVSVTGSNRDASDIYIKDNQQLTINNSAIFSQTNAQGMASDISIHSDNITVENNGQISSATYQAGDAGTIEITQAKTLTVDNGLIYSDAKDIHSAGGAGKIILASDDLIIKNEAQISSSSYGLGNTKGIDVNAKNIIISGDDKIKGYATGIFSNIALIGSAAAVNIASDNLTINQRGQINSSSFSSKGNSGAINVSAKHILLDSGIIYNTANDVAMSSAGNITVDSDNLFIKNQGKIASMANGNALGNMGDITIHANTINISGDNSIYSTGIFSDAGEAEDIGTVTGNAGNIDIDSNTILLEKGAQISSSTYSSGHAGHIILHAKKLDILGDNGKYITGIFSNAGNINFDSFFKDNFKNIPEFSFNNYGNNITNGIPNTGHAGTITIHSDEINLSNQSSISSATYNYLAHAGNIYLNANTLNIDDAKVLASAAKHSSGYTGNIHLFANESIQLKNEAEVSIYNESIAPYFLNNRQSTINLTAKDISVDNSDIYAHAINDAGQILLSFSHWLTMNHATVTTQSKLGNGGNIAIYGGDIVNVHNSVMNTFTMSHDSKMKGGDISVNTNILLLNDAQILAKADNATTGGNIDLTLKGLMASQNQLQVSGKAFNQSENNEKIFNNIQAAKLGKVTLNIAQLNVSNGLSLLNNIPFELPDLNKGSCNSQSFRNSSLVKIGKGNIALNETKFIYIPFLSSHLSEQFHLALTPHLLNATLKAENYPCNDLVL